VAAEGPTPEQQAEYLVRKLEQTIRENRTVSGMSFRTWQAIAREEILNAILAVEKRHRNHERSVNRLVLTTAASLVTIGFWGAMVAIDRANGGVAAIVTLVAGAALLFAAADWGLGRWGAAHASRKRGERLAGIEDLDRRIKRMEEEMRRKAERTKERIDSIVP